jgi:hypothetical protein
MYIGLEDHGIVHSVSDNTEVNIDENGDDKSCIPSSSSSTSDSTQKTIQTNRDNMTGISGDENIGHKRQKIDEFGSSSSKGGEVEKEGGVDDRPEEENELEQEARDLREAIYSKRMANKYVMPVLPTKEVMIARPVSSMKVHSYFFK